MSQNHWPIVAVISRIQRLCIILNSCWASLQSPLGHSRQIIKFKFNPFKSTRSYDVTGIPQSRSFGKSSILSQFLTNDSAASPLRKFHSCLGGTARPTQKCWPWLEGEARGIMSARPPFLSLGGQSHRPAVFKVFTGWPLKLYCI